MTLTLNRRSHMRWIEDDSETGTNTYPRTYWGYLESSHNNEQINLEITITAAEVSGSSTREVFVARANDILAAEGSALRFVATDVIADGDISTIALEWKDGFDHDDWRFEIWDDGFFFRREWTSAGYSGDVVLLPPAFTTQQTDYDFFQTDNI